MGKRCRKCDPIVEVREYDHEEGSRIAMARVAVNEMGEAIGEVEIVWKRSQPRRRTPKTRIRRV